MLTSRAIYTYISILYIYYIYIHIYICIYLFTNLFICIHTHTKNQSRKCGRGAGFGASQGPRDSPGLSRKPRRPKPRIRLGFRV